MSDKFQNKYRIPTARLSDWNYSNNGYYFITICTKERKHYFGEIVDDVMDLSEIGKIAKKYWFEITRHFPFVELDEFIIMPNHIHGILIINNKHKPPCRDVINHVSTNNIIFSKISPMNKHSLAEIVRWYKGRTTFEIRKKYQNFSWQTRFYDNIIRTEKSLYFIRAYIRNNARNWGSDRNNLLSNTKVET